MRIIHYSSEVLPINKQRYWLLLFYVICVKFTAEYDKENGGEFCALYNVTLYPKLIFKVTSPHSLYNLTLQRY